LLLLLLLLLLLCVPHVQSVCTTFICWDIVRLNDDGAPGRDAVGASDKPVDIDVNETVLDRPTSDDRSTDHVSKGRPCGGGAPSIMTLASTLSMSAVDMICCGM
jgi:hypothetical protein